MTYDIEWKQIVALFVFAIPIACVARTVIFEEVFREPREWCMRKSKGCNSLFQRKFFYLFTCEYCFSHYVTALFLLITGYKLMFADWKGYLIAFFSLVFVANVYLNLYSHLRAEITGQKKEIEATEKEIQVTEKELQARDREMRGGERRDTPKSHDGRHEDGR